MIYKALISETGEAFEILDGETVLEAARRSSIPLSYQCEIGACATCRIKLEQGSISYEDPIDGLTEEEIENGYVLACKAYPKSDLIFHGERRLPSCSPPKKYSVKVVEISAITSDVFRLIVDLGKDSALVYRPGQYANFLVDNHSYRSFSIAGSPKSNNLEFLIKKIPGGVFTDSLLSHINAGDLLEIELPFGNFAYHDDDYMPLIFVATGTGISPVKSILDRLMVSGDCPPIRVYWGVRSECDLFLEPEIKHWTETFDDFDFIPVLSKPSDSWLGRRGYVQDRVLDDLSNLKDYAVYLCGSPTMIKEATSLFCASGASLSHLYVDAFNFQKSW